MNFVLLMLISLFWPLSSHASSWWKCDIEVKIEKVGKVTKLKKETWESHEVEVDISPIRIFKDSLAGRGCPKSTLEKKTILLSIEKGFFEEFQTSKHRTIVAGYSLVCGEKGCSKPAWVFPAYNSKSN